MNYPIWDAPIIGGAGVIAIIAVLHVFFSHFAIGGGLYVVMLERRARRTDDAELLAVAQRHSRFFVLVVLIFGAVTGVGIWWAIALVNPSAVSHLIHLFAWVWAIEWVLFLVEIVAALIYAATWAHLDGRTHQAIGWIYAVSAWLSLVMINGIVTYMATPGRWVQTRSVVDAWLNPTMLPSLGMRTGVCVALAGVYALVTASQLAEGRSRSRVIRYSAQWVLAGMCVLPAFGVWYLMALPPMAREMAMGGTPAVMLMSTFAFAATGLVVFSVLIGAVWLPRYCGPGFACAVAALALFATGATEWVREAVRKPYVIYDHMYSTGITTSDLEGLATTGLLAASKWESPPAAESRDPVRIGRRVFRVACQSCHTVVGANGIKFAVKGWDRDFLDYQLQYLGDLKGAMPAFMGNEAERAALVEWLLSLNAPTGKEAE